MLRGKGLANSATRSASNLILRVMTVLALAAPCSAGSVKGPNAAGTFYPSSPGELTGMIDDYISSADVQLPCSDILGIISPHAGYVFSGPVAAHGYKAISGRDCSRFVILGVKHIQYRDGIFTYPEGTFKTPLGEVPVDSKTAQKLIDEKVVTADTEAFEHEHSLEVQIPFLQRCFRDFTIVPLMLRTDSYESCRRLAEALTKIMDGQTIMIASSDMSHYHPYGEAVKMDKATMGLLSQPEELFSSVTAGRNELCGLAPVVTFLEAARAMGAGSVRVLKYANSGDTAGDKSAVVGYMSAAVCREGSSMLSENNKKRLLEIAEQAIRQYLKDGSHLKLTDTDPELTRPKGAFVTLKKHGELRGCIGRIRAAGPLCETVRDMAIESATGDPRFPCLKTDELKDIDIEISALSEFEKIKDISQVKVGEHGLMIKKGPFSGLLLPQVAAEYSWDRDEFLKHVCIKAGLPEDAWREGADIYIFSAVVFGER